MNGSNNHTICVIPARGGSKRITKKNIRLFNHKPIIYWSIKAAKDSNLFDDVIVSTDDKEIAEIAFSLGATVPFLRPQHLSDDLTGVLPVIHHTISWYTENIADVTAACCIFATAPFIDYKKIIDGYKLFNKKKCSYVFSATDYGFPVQRSFSLNSDGKINLLFSDLINKRSQDLDKVYHDAGQFYWCRPNAVTRLKSMFSENSYPIILPRYLVNDIDTEDDWVMSEAMHIALKKMEIIS